MILIKLCVAAFLLCVSFGIGFIFAMVGLWSGLAYALFSLVAAIFWRWKSSGGRDRFHFLAYIVSQVALVVLLLTFTEGGLMGMHRIMDGYAAPASTQALLAFAPLGVYWACLKAWVFKHTPETEAEPEALR